MRNIAVVAPGRNVYSESFIQAHKQMLAGNVFFYYGGNYPLFFTKPGRNAGLPGLFTRVAGIFLKRMPCFYYKRLLRSLRRNRIECVLAEYGPIGARLAPICKEAGIPLIVHFHGYDASVRRVIEANREGYARMFEYASYIIGVSHAMVARLEEMGAPKEKIVYNCYGPREEFFAVHPDAATAEYFLAVGRFVDKKAPFLLLKSFKDMHDKYPGMRLIFCGDGPLFRECKRSVEHWGLNHAIDFPGPVPHSSIPGLMEGALAFVQHSVTAANGDMEGTPVGILEASASGLPVISTLHAGIPDVVIDGQTGLLSSENNTRAMTENMERIASDRKLAARMGEAGRNNIRRNFSIERHIAVLDSLIDKAIQNNPAH